ncbi:MAG: thioredoxin family protein [bacterium]
MTTTWRWMILTLVVIIILTVMLLKSSNHGTPPANPARTQNGAEQTPSDTMSNLPGSIKSKLPRLLELGSVGCKACEQMAPIIEEVRGTYQGRLSVEFYDVRKDPEPAREFGIRIIPTQIFLNANGSEVFRHEGFLARAAIDSVLFQMGVKL